jgi:hypothetical protein
MLSRGPFNSVADLQVAITQFLDAWNEAQALRLDRYRRIHSGQVVSLPPDLGADQARMHCTADTENQIASYSRISHSRFHL